MPTVSPKPYFLFSKKTRKAILFIIAAITLLCVCKLVYPMLFNNNKQPTTAALSAAADSLNNVGIQDDVIDDNNDGNNYSKKYNNQYQPHQKITPFYFDPNTLSTEGWQKLGIRDKTIAGIQKYISKGGRFKSPEDFNKIWGISDADKSILLPYIRIVAQTNTYNQYPKNNNYVPPVYQKKVITMVDVNLGDSLSLVELPGIGPGFAKRIINFREKLGGFYKVDQVAETFGLPDSTFQKIKPYLKIDANNIKKININTATLEALKAHPYIRWQLANVIMAYKMEHGNFTSIENLKKIMIIDDATYNKISPYLTL